MFDMKEIQKETMDWNREDNARSRRVYAKVTMNMLDPETEAAVETAFNEFFDKVKSLVPETVPAQSGDRVMC